ncbi:ankyrin repeat domain-containing protein [Exiguobacterium sp. s166]|uniref:ankyrin repeat domain-containing protein n=1 Tax=Exiguobacterium sp. s166 TaxID=2751204 RepID=UPI001BE8F6C2|nr:ankyrin repeat domain-containing protein [Exiguobacterium sp. s166]
MPKKSIQDYAFFGNIKKMKTCIARGDDLNALDEEGSAALHWAIEEGYDEIVTLLLNNGADINQRDKDGLTPLHLALYEKQGEIAIQLIDRGAALDFDGYGFTALHFIAARSGNKRVLRRLLEDRTRVDWQTDSGEGHTPLHYAAQEGKIKKIRMLAEAGADVNRMERNGFAPLHLAVGEGHVKAIQALLAAGADIEIENPLNENNTPLMLASQYGLTEITKLLLEHGANRQHPDAEGRTALDFAVKHRYPEIVALLQT